ncbi:MAG: hypothetical protein EA352_07880 [Gemmatimonadales bacterium]|nr:MAG: hypothetical protein EA352_07880 [Gemmatimonadales bacterium]
MTQGFPSSEDYDERAHVQYSEGDLDGALETLKEGLALYPNAVDLYVGLGYARLAREEIAWARHAFERALGLDATHEDAMVGMGETLLRLGRTREALTFFQVVEARGFSDDLELMLAMGRALYRHDLLAEARDLFARLVALRPESGEALAALGYALARMGDEATGSRFVRRALAVAPDLHEARVYLGHLYYQRGNPEGALRHFERVPPQHHWDRLALYRILELKSRMEGLETDDPGLRVWQDRLTELEAGEDDPVDRLLAEVEATFDPEEKPGWNPVDENQLELFEFERQSDARVQLRLPGGIRVEGRWEDVVSRWRTAAGFAHEPLSDFMRRMSERWRELLELEVPFTDPETFIRAAAMNGLVEFRILPG